MTDDTPKPIRPLPPGRTLEQVANHYRVEKAIADKLKRASREERKTIYATMYDELFEQVPDHPRLTKRKSDALTTQANQAKLAIVRRHLAPSMTLLEFACGDCRFAFEASRHAGHVYGVDISDQRNPDDGLPDNFELIVYDGYDLSVIADDSVDLVFSDQLIEHFHPEDTRLHFELALKKLKPGGRYVFRTPHWLSGPHDVSRFFSDVPQGFHLKEWTVREIRAMLLEAGYSRFEAYWNAREHTIALPCAYFAAYEALVGRLPKKHTRRFTKYFLPSICGAAIK